MSNDSTNHIASSNGADILDDLLSTLETKLSARNSANASQVDAGHTADAVAGGAFAKDAALNDAIADVLRSEARRCATVSLRDAPQIEAFRQSLIDGLIRADTANRLLRLINDIVLRLVP